jgi:hypothetical protein
MNSSVPKQMQDERDRAWDIAQEAARRAGMSVEQWLDSVARGVATHMPTEPARPTRAAEETPSQPARPRYSEYDTRHRRGPDDDGSAVTPLDQALYEIAERQHALDSGAPLRAEPPWPQMKGFPSLEQELRARLTMPSRFCATISPKSAPW